MGKSVKVLVVDDDEGIRDALSILLSAEGHEVECAIDGGDALEKIAQFQPSVILLDIMMTPIDGLRLLELMKENGLAKKYIVIVMTAMLGITDELQRLRETGEISEYLLKPIDENSITGKVFLLLDDIERLTQGNKHQNS